MKMLKHKLIYEKGFYGPFWCTSGFRCFYAILSNLAFYVELGDKYLQVSFESKKINWNFWRKIRCR